MHFDVWHQFGYLQKGLMMNRLLWSLVLFSVQAFCMQPCEDSRIDVVCGDVYCVRYDYYGFLDPKIWIDTVLISKSTRSPLTRNVSLYESKKSGIELRIHIFFTREKIRERKYTLVIPKDDILDRTTRIELRPTIIVKKEGQRVFANARFSMCYFLATQSQEGFYF